MGEVYLAEDSKLGRRVAIKVLPERIAKRQNSLDRFSREASAVGALNHPNIVTIHGLEEADGLRLIVMELVEGETLANMLPEEGLPADRFLTIAIPLAEAVAAAHTHGVIHRDIKPANIMVNAEGRVKVVDFGLAKLRPDLAESSGIAQPTLTREGHLVGTVTYMSPEQLRGEPADARSDVFSLGTVLYEMATGHHPFDGDTQPVIISSILCHDPKQITDVREQFPARIGAIVDRCLLKEPDKRFTDAGALYQALLGLKQALDEERILRRAKNSGASRARRAATALTAIGALVTIVMVGRRTHESSVSTNPPAANGAPLGPSVDTPAPARPPVAVLRFRNLRHDPELEWLKTGLTDMLITDLSQSEAFQVLNSEHTYEVLKELEPLENSDDQLSEMIQSVAEHTGAVSVVSGSFVRAADTYQISFKLHDAVTGEVVLTDRLQATGEASLFATIDELSRAIRTRLETAGGTLESDRDLDKVTTASLEAYRYYVEGRNLRDQGKLQEAVPLLEKAVELDPRFAMAWVRLAVVQRAIGLVGDAQHSFERAFEHVERLPDRERYYVEGQYYSDQRATYGKAIAALLRALKIDPGHNSARYTLVSLYTYLGRIDEAGKHLEVLRNHRPAIAGTSAFLGYVHAVLNEEAATLKVLKEVCAREPDSWFNRATLGWYQMLFQRFDEAESTLVQTELLRPGALHVARTRFDSAVLRSDWAEAARLARISLSSPDAFDRTEGHLDTARLSLLRGHGDQAIRQFLTDPDLGTHSPRAAAQRAVNAADTLLLLGRAAEAAELADAAIRDAPNDWPGRTGLYLGALAQEELGQQQTADRLAAQFTELVDPDLSQIEVRQAHHLKGQLALARGDLATARNALNEAEKRLLPRGINWRIVPEHVAIWWSLATTAQTASDDEEAIYWFRRIADCTSEYLTDPIRYVRSFFQLGQLYTRRGETDLARVAFTQFLEFWEDGTIDREAVAEAREALR